MDKVELPGPADVSRRTAIAGAQTCGDAMDDHEPPGADGAPSSRAAAVAAVPSSASPPLRAAEDGGERVAGDPSSVERCTAERSPAMDESSHDNTSLLDPLRRAQPAPFVVVTPGQRSPGGDDDRSSGVDGGGHNSSGDDGDRSSGDGGGRSPGGGACSCPDMAGLCAMLERLASSKACFVSQQRGEREPSASEKMQLAHGVLHRSPAAFLNRFGRYCSFRDLDYMRNFRGDYQVDYQLNRLSRNLIRKDRVTTVKNRRYEAVSRLEAEGYFDEDEMKRRDPLLYEQMVGRYLTEEELKAEADRQMKDYRFSSWLMQQADSKETSALYHLQLQQEQQQTEEGDSDEDDDDGDSSAFEQARQRSVGVRSQSASWRRSRYDDEGGDLGKGGSSQHLDDGERGALREEFLHIMQERFIDGEDHDFDYGQVDDNEEYDNLELENADAEARYFDEEEPEVATTSDLASGSPSCTAASCAVGDRDITTTGDYDY